MVPSPDIQKFADAIASRFPVDKIILFGSHAYDAPRDHSDVDLLVVMQFQGTGFRKSLEILDDLDPSFPCDLIVLTPDEFQRRYTEFNPLVGDAVDKGRVLYDRRSPILA